MTDKLFPEGAALIVGGSGGIGRFVCTEFANAGSDVAITYHNNQGPAEEAAEKIRKTGRKATTHKLSTSDAGQVAQVIADVVKAHGRLHTVVYGAAPLTEQLFISEYTIERWQKSIDQEVNGFFRVVHASLPVMKASGGGSYVHLGSAGDSWWPEKDGLSVIPKAANEALIQGLAKEEGKYGIRANTVLVGVIKAGMFLELTKQGVFDQKWIDETHKLLALKRWGEPEEIGYAAVFLASNKALYVTGQKISVSGGLGSDVMDADRLRLMLDKHELRELGLTYCRGIDRQDFALVRTLYHDDAIDDHGNMFKGGPDEYVAWLPTIMKMWDATVHSISNALYEVRGDKAEGELYVVAYHRTHAPDAKEIIVGGRYLDKYEKRNGVWKFSHRSLAMDWCNVLDVRPEDYDTFAAGAVRGRHDPGDASYAELTLFGRVGR